MLVLLHMFALFLLVLLGFYVFVADPRSRANQTFAAFIAFLALWTTKDLVFWNFYEESLGTGWWVSVSFIIALLMQCSLMVFAWVFPENLRTPRKRAAILFSPAIVLIPAALTASLWETADFNNGSLRIEFSIVAYVFVGYVYFLFFYGGTVLFRKYKRFSGTQKGQQLGAILWGLAITGILKTVANIVLPYFGNFDLLPYSAIFVLPGVLIYAYAISNFRLFSLQTALDQFRLFPITYKVAVSIAVVAIVSFVVFQVPIAWWAFKDGMDLEAWRKYIVFSVLSALVPNLLLLLLIVRTISRPLQRITLAAVNVIKGNYGTEVDMRSSNDEMGLLASSFNEMSRKMAGDIESLRQMNEQLMRADRLAAMGQLAAGVAHEVNNPLASISSLVQIIRSKQNIDEETKEQLELITSQILRITKVTRDLTDFARARPAARKEHQLSDVISDALRLARFDKTFQKINIETIFAEGMPPVMIDADQLQQVFLNLLLNSRDAMPDGGTIIIEAGYGNGTATVSISDTGSGMDAQIAQKAFEPFYTTKAVGQGTGLGLAVCYGIVNAHGGTIELMPALDHGATFLISLPIEK
jgi:signal transduction histidine kinase